MFIAFHSCRSAMSAMENYLRYGAYSFWFYAAPATTIKIHHITEQERVAAGMFIRILLLLSHVLYVVLVIVHLLLPAFKFFSPRKGMHIIQMSEIRICHSCVSIIININISTRRNVTTRWRVTKIFFFSSSSIWSEFKCIFRGLSDIELESDCYSNIRAPPSDLCICVLLEKQSHGNQHKRPKKRSTPLLISWRIFSLHICHSGDAARNRRRCELHR